MAGEHPLGVKRLFEPRKNSFSVTDALFCTLSSLLSLNPIR